MFAWNGVSHSNTGRRSCWARLKRHDTRRQAGCFERGILVSADQDKLGFVDPCEPSVNFIVDPFDSVSVEFAEAMDCILESFGVKHIIGLLVH